MERRGVMRCLVAAALFGASTPAASRLAGELNAFVFAGLLYLGAGVAVAPWALAHPPDRTALAREWRSIALAVVTGGAIGPALLVAGLARTSAASASILLNLELAATVALAATIFREHLGRRLLVGAALVTLAGGILAWAPGATVDAGALLVAGACVAWGVDNGVTARIDQLSPEHVVAFKGAIAGTANLALGLLAGGGISGGGLGIAADSASAAIAVAAALAVGAVGYGASIVLWVKGARDLGAARAQLIFATSPFIGAVIAWTALREAVTAAQLAAIAVAAAGVAVSLDAAHRHEHSHERVE
ncbi:MAG: DMT family transporter, partial [Acidimicrobiia bacterium]|nr:DMT family transporter [Acidimicrobiia bacterium]